MKPPSYGLADDPDVANNIRLLNQLHATHYTRYPQNRIVPDASIFDGGIIAVALVVFVNFLPAFVVGVPLYYGLEILRGTHGNTMPSAFVGAMVLVGGLIVGLVVQFGWYWMFEKLGHAIWG